MSGYRRALNDTIRNMLVLNETDETVPGLPTLAGYNDLRFHNATTQFS